MEFSVCADCGDSSIWAGAAIIALGVVLCVALGYAAQRAGELAGQPFSRTAAIVTIATVIVAAALFLVSGSLFITAPCLATLLGLFHRKTPAPSVFHGGG